MKKQKDKTFQEELAELLERRGVSEFKGQFFDEVLLQTAKPMLEKLLNTEMDEHLGYDKQEKMIHLIREMVIPKKVLKIFLDLQKLKHQEIVMQHLNQSL